MKILLYTNRYDEQHGRCIAVFSKTIKVRSIITLPKIRPRTNTSTINTGILESTSNKENSGYMQ